MLVCVKHVSVCCCMHYVFIKNKLTAKGHLKLDHMSLRFEVIFSIEICADDPPDQKLGYFKLICPFSLQPSLDSQLM